MTRHVRIGVARGILLLAAFATGIWGVAPAAASAPEVVETSHPAGSFAGGWVGTIHSTVYSYYTLAETTYETTANTTFTLDGKQDSDRINGRAEWFQGAAIFSTFKQVVSGGGCTYTEKGRGDWTQRDGAVNVLFSTSAAEYQLNAGAEKSLKTKWTRVCEGVLIDSGTNQVGVGAGSVQVGTAVFSGGQFRLSGSVQAEQPDGYTLIEWDLTRRPALKLVGLLDYYGTRSVQIDVAGNDSSEVIMDADMWARYPGAYVTTWSVWTGTVSCHCAESVAMLWNDHYGGEDQDQGKEKWDIQWRYVGPDSYAETVKIINYGPPDSASLDTYRNLKIHGPGTMASVEHWMAVRLLDQNGQVIGSVSTKPASSDNFDIELTATKRKTLYWS